MSDFEESSNKNMVHHHISLFQRIREKGVKATRFNRSTLFKLAKLGLIYYNRETRRYLLTMYGEKLLRQVEEEGNNLLEVQSQ